MHLRKFDLKLKGPLLIHIRDDTVSCFDPQMESKISTWVLYYIEK